MMTGKASANQLRREDYKTIKHMDKAQLTAYLQRVYRRGYDAGVAAERDRTASKPTSAVPTEG